MQKSDIEKRGFNWDLEVGSIRCPPDPEILDFSKIERISNEDISELKRS